MAKTYFEYADRQPESQINWFKVGSDITEKIKKEDDLREKRKAATEEQFRKDTKELATAPQGNSDIVNKWTLNYANDATEYLLQINKLLKSGGIKPKDYNIINQNLRDGTSILFDLSKEYQAEMDEKIKRGQPGGDGSASETQIMGMIEGFGNLKDTKAIINPLNGAISVGKIVKGKDGTEMLAEGEDNYMTVNQLRNRIKQKIDKYKVNEDLEGEAKLLGDVVNEVVSKTGSSTETGFMTKVTDQTKRVGLSQDGQQAVDAYIKTENDIVKSKLTNPYNTSSILFDWTGGIDPKTNQPYQVVFDEKLANTSSHYVLFSMQGGVLKPDFDSTANGKEQKKTAENYIRNKFRSMLEQKTELQPFQQPGKQYAPAYVYEAGKGAKNEQTQGNMIGMLYSGTPEQQQAAVNYFMGLPGVTNVTRDDNGVSITRNGEIKTLPFINKATNTRMSLDEFVRSSSSGLLGKETDVTNILKGAISTGSKNFQSGNAQASSQSTDPNEMYGNYVNTKINTSLISTDADNDKAEVNTLKQIKPLVQAVGFEAVIPSTPFTAGRFIKINGNGKTTGEVDLSEPTKAIETIQSFLLANVPGETQQEKMMHLMGLAKKGVLKENEPPPPPPPPPAKKPVNPKGVGSKYNTGG
jgi:hypothetical protein